VQFVAVSGLSADLEHGSVAETEMYLSHILYSCILCILSSFSFTFQCDRLSSIISHLTTQSSYSATPSIPPENTSSHRGHPIIYSRPRLGPGLDLLGSIRLGLFDSVLLFLEAVWTAFELGFGSSWCVVARFVVVAIVCVEFSRCNLAEV
jgi:hypothetical protein